MKTKTQKFTVADCAKIVFAIRDTPVADILRHAVRVGTEAVLFDRYNLCYEFSWADKTRSQVESWTVPKSELAISALNTLPLGSKITAGMLELGHVESVASLTQRCRTATTEDEVLSILLSCDWEVQTRTENRKRGHK